MNLLEGLNEEQYEAVTHLGGPLLLVAGAGTGKTTVITQRIAWLIEQQHAAPDEILALTFTDKAAGEMEERVDLLMPIGFVERHIGTFHSFCEWLLRQYGAEFGMSPRFRVLDERESWLLMRSHLHAFPLEQFKPRGNPTKYLQTLLKHISRLKDEGVTPEQYTKFVQGKEAALSESSDDADKEEVARWRELCAVYTTYESLLDAQDAVDFGGLITQSVRLLRERAHVRKQLQAQFKYVLVDEFQDTNAAQYQLVKLLLNAEENITIVGDDDQGIYQFRGATIENILAFPRDFPEAKRLVLSTNYRSHQEILDAAHRFIQHNNPHRLEAWVEGGINKKLTAHRQDGGEVSVKSFARLDEEVRGVVQDIVNRKANNPQLRWSDFAILVRANDAGTPFVKALESVDVPVTFSAQRGLYAKTAILDALALLRCLVQPHDDTSITRLLLHPAFQVSTHGIGALARAAKKHTRSVFDVLPEVHESISEKDQLAARNLHACIQSLGEQTKEQAASAVFIRAMYDSGMVRSIQARGDAVAGEWFSHLQSFLRRVREFEQRSDDTSLQSFLLEFEEELAAGESGDLPPDIQVGPDTVKVMSIHASKGLEFPHVYVVNLVNQRFPTSRRGEALPIPEVFLPSQEDPKLQHLHEERRLMYVALTRARDSVTMTYAEDYGGARKRKPSIFIDEIAIESHEGAVQEGDGIVLVDSEQLEALSGEGGSVETLLPSSFSYTQLSIYETCPLQYKLGHVLQIPRLGNWALSFGTTMHDTLHQALKLFMETQALPSLEELYELFDHMWRDEWYIDVEQKASYRAHGKELLQAWRKRWLVAPGAPAFLEQPFTLRLGEYTLRGRIDRIDKTEEGFEIIDYKTGTPKERLSGADKEQLLLYQIASKDVLGIAPIKLTFEYLENGARLSFLGKEEECKAFEETLLTRMNRIRTGSFDATPGYHCGWCDFADICDKRQQ